ncbi:hypothetical protein SNE40_001520 [Patella caerulea]|uniref:Uncharacterized protein n=1 Tax=Patella caerulea TaxID=87958 RepID=A0AAN8KHR6_PATCE
MRSSSALLIVVCLAVSVYEFETFCYIQMKDPSGDNEPCVTDVGNLSVGESRDSFPLCISYSCGVKYIDMCGIGYNAGVMHVAGCDQVKMDDCCYRFVNASNPAINCTDVYCP